MFALIFLFLNLFLFKYFIFSKFIFLNTDIYFLKLIFNNYFPFLLFKIFFIIFCFLSHLIIFNLFFKKLNWFNSKKSFSYNSPLNLLIGKNSNNENIYIPEKSLYQNILVTGSIGSGKTASALYPFTKQLINFNSCDFNSKLGMLVLDVKGNYYSKIVEFAIAANRLDDLIIIELNGKYKYNPLHKPKLSASVLANRLKQILLLFSPNNSESYWLDTAEHVLEAFITICRFYNSGYVSFYELHKLISTKEYFYSKFSLIREEFLNNNISTSDFYNLSCAINYLENEFFP